MIEGTVVQEVIEEQSIELVQPPSIKVNGKCLDELPQDLYIPPDALTVFLETFEGPLDLLLYLIKRNNLDILNIPIAEVTRQYIHYIQLMEQQKIELMAEYLVMAAMLAEIKSRMLLPQSAPLEEDDTDPRAELIRRLQEYERYRIAATDLNNLPFLGRDYFHVEIQAEHLSIEKPQPDVELDVLLQAMQVVMARCETYAHHQITQEPLSVRERMTIVLDKLKTQSFVEFSRLFTLKEGRTGVVVTFIALLELIKESLIEVVQSDVFAPIHVKLKTQ